MIYNTKSSYGIVSIVLHWLISISIITMLSVGFYMTSLEPSADKWELYGMHKATGFTLLILITFRFFWRMRNVAPDLPRDTPKWQCAASQVTHYILYFMMFAMPLSGTLMSLFSGKAINVFGIFTVPAFEKKAKYAKLFNELHDGLAILFIVIISLHVLAALYHHFIKKDNVLRRMIIGS